MRPFLEARDVSIRTAEGRVLFEGLDLRLEREKVALVGRNGVGKSTLLSVLAREQDPDRGRVSGRTTRLVPQRLNGAGSPGELRRSALDAAFAAEPEVLLLDEPTEDLDAAGMDWLRRRLASFAGALVVASHDRSLLGDFRDFFLASESGCQTFHGSLDELDGALEAAHRASEERYARNLRRLARHEEHAFLVAARRARKKRYGRFSEIDRVTAPIRRNAKRGQAQVNHGRSARVREARLDAIRTLSKATRRPLAVELGLALVMPRLPPSPGPAAVLEGVAVTVEDRLLFEGVDLAVGRERIAIVGPNGSGKTTLLEVLLGLRRPIRGRATVDRGRLGNVDQGGRGFALEVSLVELLSSSRSGGEPPVADVLHAHRFPQALAARPMATLSAGERARAALIALAVRSPPIDVLVLDEPTASLDLLGQRALTDALRAWPGGLVVATHDRALLRALELDRIIALGSSSSVSWWRAQAR